MTAAAFTEAELLAVWEAGLDQSPLSRALLLTAAAMPGHDDGTQLADLSLGRRDALLLTLRERCFGGQLPCAVTCPRCVEQLELSLTVADLRVDSQPPDAPAQVEMAGVVARFRPPTSRNLFGLDPTAPDARRSLVEACIVDARAGDERLSVEALPDEVVEAVAARLADTDPQSDIVLDLSCSACAREWIAPFDVPGFLWLEVDAYARRLLYDIHSLALAYGWSEAEVLAVSPARRRFYLEAAPA